MKLLDLFAVARQLTLTGFIYIARVPAGSIPARAYLME